MVKYITEILQEVNDDPTLLTTTYKNNNALKFVFEHAYLPHKKFVLPDGEPPYKKDAAPIGMSPGNFLMETKRFYVFCREDLQPIRRESLFVQLLENVHPDEAKVLLMIKDQSVHKTYKKLTYKTLAEAGYLPMEHMPKKPQRAKATTSKTKTPAKATKKATTAKS